MQKGFLNSLRAALCCLFAVSLIGCTIFDREHVSTEKIPIILGAKATPSERWQNACVVEVEQQMRSVEPSPFVHEFWYQTPALDAPFFPPNLTQKGLITMNRCHIQGTVRLRADGYMVFSANSQDRPLGEGKRKWALNNCPSLHTSQGGGAHLFVAELGRYQTRSGHPWGDRADILPGSEGTPNDLQIVRNILLSTDDDVLPPDVGSLEELYHPGGIGGVGDFVYVAFDGIGQKSYLKIFDMSDPADPKLVGGRGFENHKGQALAVTDLEDGRILLAVVDTNQDTWKVHFYIESENPESGEINRHQFTEAGVWEETDGVGKRSQQGFPFLKYQSLALLRECSTQDIFLVGIHNERRLRCGGLIEAAGFRAPTRVDLYKLRFPGSMGSGARFELEQRVRRNMRDHKGEGCAGATIHVTPRGQIVGYTIEHGGVRQTSAGSYSDGLERWVGKIRFYEYPTQVAIATLEDRDGVNHARDLCPDEAEDFDGYLDSDGCPDWDNDADGIHDTKDLCPNKSEDQDGINDIDGCSESETAQIFKNQIVLSHDRLFETHDENELSHAARFLLKGVIDWWQENGTGDICVTAHTNRQGHPQNEQRETDLWADIVAREIVELGVSTDQIEARGLGSRHLVVAPNHPDAVRLNVRIELSQCILDEETASG